MAKQSIKYLYPFPVFEGHFDDGSVLRMSFYSPAGKPVDHAAGARLVTGVTTAQMFQRQIGGKMPTIVNEPVYGPFVRIDGRWRQPALGNDRKLISGFVEHPSIGRVAYHADQVAAKRTAKATRGALIAAMKALLAGDPVGRQQAEFLLAHEAA